MTALAKHDTSEVARPLKVLEKLIREDIEAGEKAGMAFYKAAGEKLYEAKEGYYDTDPTGFWKWAEPKFGKTRTTLRTWMALGIASDRKSFASLNKFNKESGRPYKKTPLVRDWTTQVDGVAERARNEQRRLAAQEELTRAQERAAEEKLGLRLIDIGFRVLARELHPDKGGSREAMARLNRVRERLRTHV